ncbi:MAG TPA: hypothetical protein VGX25_34825 [Actinophytocola sp.]|uniref:hypothetical protein n=1 Tax=Actinophytocola sp. TaxID=1872138 RepID=UPI002DDD9914|nr:hypothetical protein [Actinophytocola sp.]HEV2784586.1 hypothetical protein [Actinophytocola sp.]
MIDAEIADILRGDIPSFGTTARGGAGSTGLSATGCYPTWISWTRRCTAGGMPTSGWTDHRHVRVFGRRGGLDARSVA